LLDELIGITVVIGPVLGRLSTLSACVFIGLSTLALNALMDCPVGLAVTARLPRLPRRMGSAQIPNTPHPGIASFYRAGLGWLAMCLLPFPQICPETGSAPRSLNAAELWA